MKNLLMGPGLISWILASAAAFLLTRLIRAGRLSPAVEFILAVIAGLAAGMTATALDFGGWREPDPRAIAFAFLIALALLGITRGATLLARR